MKKIVKSFVFLSLVFMTSSMLANSSTPPALMLKKIDASRFRMEVAQLKSALNVSIKDAWGETLYDEDLKIGHAHRKIFDISQLPQGTYYLKLVNANSTQLYDISNAEVRLLTEVSNRMLNEQGDFLAVLIE